MDQLTISSNVEKKVFQCKNFIQDIQNTSEVVNGIISEIWFFDFELHASGFVKLASLLSSKFCILGFLLFSILLNEGLIARGAPGYIEKWEYKKL